MITGSSALYGNVKRKTPSSPSGISTLPYYPDVQGAPQNTVIGGASLWVMSGKKPDEYKGVAQFFTYLSEPEVQAESHQRTGYLPITHRRLRADRKVGLLQEEPGHRRRGHADDPQDHRQVARHPPRQLRADPHHHRRGAGADLERQEDAPRKALDAAVKRGNEQLRALREGEQGLSLDRLGAVDGTLPALPAERGGLVRRSAWRWKSASVSVAGGCPGCCSRRRWRSSWCSSSGRRGRRCYQCVLQQDAFGTSTEFVGLRELPATVRTTTTYLASFQTTAVFSVLVAVLRPRASSLLLAVFADRVVRGAAFYKTLLIWPYAVAPAVAGVLWLFMFAPSVGIVTLRAARRSASTGTTCSTATMR